MLTNERKAELFDQFVTKMARFAHYNRVIQCLIGNISREDEVFNADYKDVFDAFLETLSEEETEALLKQMLPTVLEVELGAKKVQFDW